MIEGLNDIKISNRLYGEKLIKASRKALDYTMTKCESDGKKNAPWTDRTGNARNSILGQVFDEQNVIRGSMSIGMPYGVDLETGYQGRYRIIWPTMEANRKVLQGFLKAININIK